jgi:hypothetical protein
VDGYDEIPRSNVPLLLVAEAPAKSNWVAREIEFSCRIYIAAYLDEDAKYVKETLDKDKEFFQPKT